MDVYKIKERIKQNPKLAKLTLLLLMHPIKTRPRKWVRIFLQPFYIKRGKNAVIYRSVRKDIVPFNHFEIGDGVVIEDFATVNNAVGEIIVGKGSRIGLGNTIIGPVHIGDHVDLAQNVTVSGLNHNYEDVTLPINQQGVSTAMVTIADDVWIGANSVVLAGVTIGKHVVIGAGSVVTRDIPSYSLALGKPARVIKKYDFKQNQWVRV